MNMKEQEFLDLINNVIMNIENHCQFTLYRGVRERIVEDVYNEFAHEVVTDD